MWSIRSRREVEVGATPAELVALFVQDANPIHDLGDIRFDVEMMSEPFAVRKIAGVIIADKVA